MPFDLTRRYRMFGCKGMFSQGGYVRLIQLDVTLVLPGKFKIRNTFLSQSCHRRHIDCK